jgi:hypothetical protein
LRTPSLTPRRQWAQFVGRELAVMIFIELLQGLRSLGNFLGVDFSIAIEIQSHHERRRHGARGTAAFITILAFRWRTARPVLIRAWSAVSTRSFIGTRTAIPGGTLETRRGRLVLRG